MSPMLVLELQFELRHDSYLHHKTKGKLIKPGASQQKALYRQRAYGTLDSSPAQENELG